MLNDTKEQKIRNAKGITLIALVITIIILLILAAVSIAMLTGQNGIITKANEAKVETEKSNEKEKIAIAVTSAKISDDGYEDLNQENLQSAINDQFGKGKASVIDNKDGTYRIITDSGKSYIIDNNGNITETIDDTWDGKSVSSGLYGKGTEEQPFLIQSASDLVYLREQINSKNIIHSLTDSNYDQMDNSNTNYKMTKNINLNKPDANWKEWNEKTIGLYNWKSIGTYTSVNEYTPFRGSFDGNNRQISYLYINCDTRCGGLFSTLDGSIKNLVVTNSYVRGYGGLGGIVGWSSGNKSQIINCINYANVYGTDSTVGGIAGSTAGKIEGCINRGVIIGNYYDIGGITGFTEVTGIIEKSKNDGNISILNNGFRGSSVGGIVGTNSNLVMQCCNYGEISSINNSGQNIPMARVGGIVGNQTIATTENCYNAGKVFSKYAGVGGIVGDNSNGPSYIYNCYNTGKIVSEDYPNYCGAIIGWNEINSTTRYCYWLENSCICNNSGYGDNEANFQESSFFKKENNENTLNIKCNESTNLLDSLNNYSKNLIFKKDFKNFNDGYPIFEWE